MEGYVLKEKSATLEGSPNAYIASRAASCLWQYHDDVPAPVLPVKTNCEPAASTPKLDHICAQAIFDKIMPVHAQRLLFAMHCLLCLLHSVHMCT
jgi:hypothetical protein